MSDLIERLLDNAATCSQERGMLDDGALRECVRLNVADPLAERIAKLEAALKAAKSYRKHRSSIYGDLLDVALEEAK